MWQRFSERARKVVFYSQEEAGRLGENYVSTEHLLLGLVRENDSAAARILDRIGVSLGRIRSEVQRQVTPGDGRPGQDMQLTPRAKRVIDLAYDEARQLNNNYIGTEHLLLGLINEGEGLAGRVLSKLGVSLDRARREVLLLQDKGDSDNPTAVRSKSEPRHAGRYLEDLLKDLDGIDEQAPDDLASSHLVATLIYYVIHEAKPPIIIGSGEALNLDLRGQKSSLTVSPHLYTAIARGLGEWAGMDVLDQEQTVAKAVPIQSRGKAHEVSVCLAPGPAGQQIMLSARMLEAQGAADPDKPMRAPSQRMAPPRGRSAIADVLHEHRLRGRDILGIEHLSLADIRIILDVSRRLKENKFDATQTLFAKGQTLAMLFEKPSLRTRVTFEAGMTQLGGSAIYLEGKLGVREAVPDVARNLDRWLDGIMARTFSNSTVHELAEYASVPVINGLCDREHPCQAFADFQTLAEQKSRIAGLKLAYVGDGNNVAHSLALLSAKVGTDFSLACPEGYEPDQGIWAAALAAAAESGATLLLTHDPVEAVTGADAVYTDVWASMGQEEEAAVRGQIFAPFQVNAALVSHAKPDHIIMHCLPAHRGEEITAEVFEGPHSVVFDQAENRLHAQKAIMALVL